MKMKLLDLIEKTKQTFVLIVLTNCVYATSNFDFWMFKGVDDIFILIVNFLGIDFGCQNTLQLACMKHLKLQSNINKNSQDL